MLSFIRDTEGPGVNLPATHVRTAMEICVKCCDPEHAGGLFGCFDDGSDCWVGREENFVTACKFTILCLLNTHSRSTHAPYRAVKSVRELVVRAQLLFVRGFLSADAIISVASENMHFPP